MEPGKSSPKANVKDVAVLAGVSASTVSNYFNRPDAVLPETRDRITDAVAKLGYIRNESARQLRAGRSRTFALILLDAWIPFYSELSRGVEDVAAEHGWTVLFSNSARDVARERRSLDIFASHGLQGILIIPSGDVNGRLRELQHRGISCVTIEQSKPADDISAVSLDDILGGRLAAEHLITTGRTRLAFIGNPTKVSHVRDRLQGFSDAADRAATATTLTLVEVDDLTMSAGITAAQQIIDMPAAERPTGILAANDLIALGALQALLSAGIRVPEDIALVGYDDIDFAAQAVVPLTTVRQPAYEMGRAGAEILIAEMEGSTDPGTGHIVFEPTLVQRASAPGTENTHSTAGSRRSAVAVR